MALIYPFLIRYAGINDGNADGVLCQATSVNAFKKLRDMDAPVSIALTESQNHNFSYIGYIAIPFYEAVMKQRMPQDGGTVMNDLDRTQTWLGDTLTHQLYKESTYTGDKNPLCLFPDEAQLKTGKNMLPQAPVADKTPPPAPFNLAVTKAGTALEITWAADADIESGILRFEIFKDDVLAGSGPESGAYQQFDTNGDNTNPVEVAAMKFWISCPENANATISVRTINHFNLASGKAQITYTK